MTVFRLSTPSILSFLFGAAVTMTSWPTAARACGGTFCEAGPTSMPVDQTGENVLFLLDGRHVEAHIQINVDPSSGAEDFAWIIPMPNEPEFSLGSQPLFDALLQATVPTFVLDSTREACRDVPLSLFACAGGLDSAGNHGDDEHDGNDGVDIIAREFVGAFEITVLDSPDVESLMSWLDTHGYENDPAAKPIMAEYLESDHLFVALKLRAGAGLDEVQPIVLRYEGDESCVPIRLTRIAAADDMKLRVFFLGDHRTVPTNYRHVEINPLRVNWLDDASNYDEVVSFAADSDLANGHAFVTEYAGPSNIVDTDAITGSAFNLERLDGDLDPVEAIDHLRAQGLLECARNFGEGDGGLDGGFDEGDGGDDGGDGGGELGSPRRCRPRHPLLAPILDTYLPVPAHLSAEEFYGCPACFREFIDLEAWDRDGFVDTLSERIVVPAYNARHILNANPYLTRMFTTISPHEMTLDPVFRENPDLPEVDNEHRAVASRRCNGATTVELENGDTLVIRDGQWPDFDESMPWARRVDQATTSGPLMNLADHEATIRDMYADWNGNELPSSIDSDRDGVPESAEDGCRAAADHGMRSALSWLMILGVVRWATRRPRVRRGARDTSRARPPA